MVLKVGLLALNKGLDAFTLSCDLERGQIDHLVLKFLVLAA